MPLIYFFDFPTSHKITPITTATINTPTHTPALKISPIAWQLLRPVIKIANTDTSNAVFFFMFLFFKF